VKVAREVRALTDEMEVPAFVKTSGSTGLHDFLQNGHGKLLAAPLSARPVPKAVVSTPLEWSEVTSRLDASRFTIRTVPARLSRKRADPLRPVLGAQPDLSRALARLAGRVTR
jgi:bifunctional non-homologous end joining protein LigD